MPLGGGVKKKKSTKHRKAAEDAEQQQVAADAGRACKCITCCAACLPPALTGKQKSSKSHKLAAVPVDELPASLKAVLNADEKKEAPLAVVRKEDQIYEKEFEMEMERAKVRLLLTGKQVANSSLWPGRPLGAHLS